MWTNIWGVKINPSKTSATIFFLSHTVKSIKLHFQDKELPYVEQPTYFDVRLDKRLTWKTHILNTESKAKKKLEAIKKS
jgi:hypothetical protein